MRITFVESLGPEQQVAGVKQASVQRVDVVGCASSFCVGIGRVLESFLVAGYDGRDTGDG